MCMFHFHKEQDKQLTMPQYELPGAWVLFYTVIAQDKKYRCVYVVVGGQLQNGICRLTAATYLAL